MHIQSIELTNFRCFAGARLELPTRVTFVVGANDHGKSSVVDALKWTLAGHCRGTAADGKGSDSLIRDAAGIAAMKVALEVTTPQLPKPFIVERMQNAKNSTLAIGGQTGNRNDGIATLTERFGVSQAVIAACLDSEAFLALHHADAKNLLLDVLDVRVPVDGQSLTLTEVEQRYQHWYGERKTRGGALKAIHVPEKPADDQPDVAAIEAKLAGLREEEKALIAESSEEAGRRVELDRQLASATASKARLDAKLLTVATAAGLDGAKVDLDDAVLELQERIATQGMTEAEVVLADSARVTLVSVDGRLRLLKDQIAAVENHSPERGCVLNPAIECRTPAKSFTAELKAIKTEQANLESAMDDASKLVEAARLRLVDSQQLERRLGVLQAQVKDRASVLGDIATLTDSITRLTFERDATAAAAGPAPGLDALRERITRGQQVLQDARDAVQVGKAYVAAHDRQKAAAKALAEAERQVDTYGPTGARVPALAAALSDFQARINAALARFGYDLRFHADPWMVLVNGRPAQLLSRSGHLRVGIALQLALAEVSGFGFVAIDEVDLFDTENRRAFGSLLDATPVQVLAAMTRDDDFVPPTIEDWSWARVVHVNDVSVIVPADAAVLA